MKFLELAVSRLRPPTGPRIGPIGFHVAAERVSAVQMERAGEALRVRAAAELELRSPIDSAAELRGCARELLRGRPFSGRDVVSAIPADRVKLMVLHYKAEAARPEADVILGLVDERTPEALDECVIDYVPIRPHMERAGEQSALVAIAREEAVLAHLELLRSAGLRVEALEIAPISVRRLLASLPEQSRENALVLHFGPYRSDLTVLWGRRLILYREVDFGEVPAIERLRSSLDVPAETAASLLAEYGMDHDVSGAGARGELADASEIATTIAQILMPSLLGLAEEVANALVYTASRMRGESVDGVYLLGRLAHWPGADRVLEGLVSLPVRVLDPLRALGFDDVRAVPAGSDPCVAAGLALRGLGEP